MMYRGWSGFALLMVLINVDVWQSAQSLPAQVASKFDFNGVPVSFMARESYIVVWQCVLNGVTLVSAGAFALIRVIPDDLINLPHKEHWLGGAERGATLNRLQRYGLAISALTALFMWWIHRGIVTAHASSPPVAEPIWIGLATYLVLLFAVLGMMVASFSRLPGGNKSK